MLLLDIVIHHRLEYIKFIHVSRVTAKSEPR